MVTRKKQTKKQPRRKSETKGAVVRYFVEDDGAVTEVEVHIMKAAGVAYATREGYNEKVRIFDLEALYMSREEALAKNKTIFKAWRVQYGGVIERIHIAQKNGRLRQVNDKYGRSLILRDSSVYADELSACEAAEKMIAKEAVGYKQKAEEYQKDLEKIRAKIADLTARNVPRKTFGDWITDQREMRKQAAKAKKAAAKQTG